MAIDKEKIDARKKDFLERLKTRTTQKLDFEKFKPDRYPKRVFESDKPKPPPKPSLHDLPKKKVKGICVKCKTKIPMFRAIDKETGSSEISYKECPKCKDTWNIMTMEDYEKEQKEKNLKHTDEVLKWL